MNTSHHRIAEVERYIHELAIALSGLPAEDREDVIAGIRSHIDDALLAIDDPSPADVQRVLDGLGDPLAIAADAGANSNTDTASGRVSADGRPATGGPRTTKGASPGSETATLEHHWVPAAVILSFAGAALLTLFVGTGVTPVAAVAWLFGLVVLVASPLWTGFEKVVGVVTFGVTPVVGTLALLAFAGWGPLPPGVPFLPWGRGWEFGPQLGYWFDALRPAGLLAVASVTALGLAVVGGWLWRRGAARVRA